MSRSFVSKFAFKTFNSGKKLTLNCDRTLSSTVGRIFSGGTANDGCNGFRNKKRNRSSFAGFQSQNVTSNFDSGLAGGIGELTGVGKLWVVFPHHVHHTGVVNGRALVDRIVDIATFAANRRCPTKKSGVELQPASCSFKSIDELKFFEPLLGNDCAHVKADVVSLNNNVITVEVSVIKSFPFKSDEVRLVNFARLSFEVDAGGSSPTSDNRGELKSRKEVEPKNIQNGRLFERSAFLSQPFHSRQHCLLMMEEYGLMSASRLTRHNVVTVDWSDVKLLQPLESGMALSMSCEVVSEKSNILTMFLKVDVLQSMFREVAEYRTAEGTISYAPIDSRREAVSMEGLQIDVEASDNFTETVKEVDGNIVRNYLAAFRDYRPHVFW